jgi:hypothetical protein
VSGEAVRIVGDGEDYVLMVRLTGVSVKTDARLDMPILEYWRVEEGLITIIRPHYFDTMEAARLAG